MTVRIWPLALLVLSGCAADIDAPVGLSDDLRCQKSQLTIDTLKRELGMNLRAQEPATLSSPTRARQNEMMRVMRAAAAQEKVRQALAAELEFQSRYCP